jgi:hypothetical protein
MSDDELDGSAGGTLIEAKPWYQSETMLAGVTQVVGGIVLIGLAVIMKGQDSLMLVGIGAITTGLATLRGRVNASQPIAPLTGPKG